MDIFNSRSHINYYDIKIPSSEFQTINSPQGKISKLTILQFKSYPLHLFNIAI